MFQTPSGRTLITCLFDLDDTLYPRAAGVMTAVGERITDYMQQRLKLDPETTAQLRYRFYNQYGTALRGLQLEHAGLVDAEDYLRYVHDIDVATFVQPAPDLNAALAALPLEKVVFTNSTREHAERVLARLGVRQHFAQIVDLRAFDYYCKPDPRAYARLLALIGRPAEACIFVEDTVRNLRPAGELGMVTVLVDPHAQSTAGFDFWIPRVEAIGTVVAQLQAGVVQARPQSKARTADAERD